jgi:predicted dehydrogenase
MIKRFTTFLITCTLAIMLQSLNATEPIRLGVIALTHTHVHWILDRADDGDFILAGIVEPNKDLALRYTEQYGISMDIVYNTMQEMVENIELDGVTAFGTIYDHLEVVEFFAPRGIHVMVEKPLAANLEHANKMMALAKKHNIHLLTNYETTWYPANHKAFELVKENKIGSIRKVIVRDGHKGPVKLGINSEFLDWLLDPELNGGGAIIDFGCYGANLMTWLMDGKRPNTVTAITQQLQPHNHPKVDDEATIILTYDSAQAVIQASWNWPIGRKDMEIYGLTGAIYADNRHTLRTRIAEGYDGYSEEILQLEERPQPLNDPFKLFSAVIKGELTLDKYDLSSLENNMIAMEILDAAVKSAKSGRTVNIH